MADPSRLSLQTRDVGRVTIVQCNGRIVAGGESESLRSHVAWLLRDRRSIVLHLGEVNFIDSSGLGTIVRTLTSTRQARGDLKLCNVPERVRNVLELSQLTKLFDTHDSEESAVAAFYQPRGRSEEAAHAGRTILCVDGSVDVLAYLRELLRRAGYDVHTTCYLRDAMTLARVTKFDLVLAGSDLGASPAARQAFYAACSNLAVIELGSEFSTLDADEASSELLQRIGAVVNAKSA